MTASIHELEQHRKALTGHCYRMLGSVVEADDAVQEAMVRAWKSIDRFDGRASLRTWLYKIATNVCLDVLAERKGRVLAVEERPAGSVEDKLESLPRTHWLEPVPDARVLPEDADPSELTVLRESIRLAFVAALQVLPPRQRAVLLLTEVLGWSAQEVAESLETSVASVNSALQRARATLSTRDFKHAAKTSREDKPLSSAENELLARYLDAFQRYDVDTLTALLHDDAKFSMPPIALWLQGPAAVRAWLLGRGAVCQGSRLVPLDGACGSPAFAQYHADPAGGFSAWALVVLEHDGARITSWTSFLDTETLFPRFGLPLKLD